MEPNAAKTGRRQHALLQVLANNKGNPRTLILIEPLWGIPYNLITPFATLYMYTLGVTDVQIGLILSVTMVVQVIIAFLGGILTSWAGNSPPCWGTFSAGQSPASCGQYRRISGCFWLRRCSTVLSR